MVGQGHPLPEQCRLTAAGFEKEELMAKILGADFVVVGAGFAGLTAAWRLVNAKPAASVIVLEARPDRVEDER